MNNNGTIAIVLVLVIAIGAYAIYQHDKNTATIDLPGDAQIEITE